jgi:hypothetical protein
MSNKLAGVDSAIGEFHNALDEAMDDITPEMSEYIKSKLQSSLPNNLGERLTFKHISCRCKRHFE